MKNHTFAILAHKESPYLEDCINSLKKQTLASEIILCTSTPNNFLEKIAKKHQLPIFINPEKRSIAADWNFAIKQCSTKYFTLAHQDDLYFPEYTEKMCGFLNLRVDSLIGFTNYNEIIHENKNIRIREHSLNFLIKNILNKIAFSNKNYLEKNKAKILIFGNPIGCPTVTYCKENIGKFHFDEKYSVNLDWKAWYDLSKQNGSFLWLKEIMMSHRIHIESETSQGLTENRRQQEDLQMFEKFWPKSIAKIFSKIYSLSYKNNN